MPWRAGIRCRRRRWCMPDSHRPLLGARARSVSACGPLRTVADVLSCEVHARRGRRCPAGAHAGAVFASLRLHCDARAGVASQNSLRSLRSLRSDSCDESVDEARWRAPTPALRFSSPQKSPLPDTACREAPMVACGPSNTSNVAGSGRRGVLRSEVKEEGEGEARAGGHERSRAPRRPDPAARLAREQKPRRRATAMGRMRTFSLRDHGMFHSLRQATDTSPC
jgi:hypothetical protein